MAHEGSLITAPVDTDDVSIVLGVASDDVGVLCTHPNINFWARYKPNGITSNLFTDKRENERTGAVTIPSFAALDINYLGVLNQALWSYTHENEIYRLDDFDGYNHNAFAPIYGLDYTPYDIKISIGETINVVYRPAGINLKNVGFWMDALKDRYLGIVISGEKSNGTTETGEKFNYNYLSQYRQYKINNDKFYDSSLGGYVGYTISITLQENAVIKSGAWISCLLALFDSRDITTSRVTSMMLPAKNPEDIFIAPTTLNFQVR